VKIKGNDPDCYGLFDAAHPGEERRLYIALARQPAGWRKARARRIRKYRRRAARQVALFQESDRGAA
jgi:hypothetical protein